VGALSFGDAHGPDCWYVPARAFRRHGGRTPDGQGALPFAGSPLSLLLAGTLAGADDFSEMERWGNEQLAFLRRLLSYQHGIPSHDTLGEVEAALDPALFKTCFVSWVEGLRETASDIVSIDGKKLRRSYARSKGLEPLHLVSAWASR
jgi:hypothetical protein